MPNYNNRFARVSTVLTADVATAGTFTVAYPSGFAQGDFTAGLVRNAGHYAVVNGNDRWTAAASQISATYGASLITVTNSSGITWSAGSTVDLFFDVADGNNVLTLAFPINLASITGTQDVVTDFRPGVDGVIEDVSFVTNVPATTAAKLATLNVEINTTNLTGGLLALTTVGANTMGKIVQGTDITALNVLTKKDAISIEAASVTAFVEGSGTVYVRIRLTNSDSI